MENIINLLAYFIGETVTEVTEKQRAQFDLAYAKTRAVHKKDIELLRSLFEQNDAEVDELITHWGEIKEGK